MNILIYGKDQCPFCDKAVHIAQQVCQESKHTYEYKKLGRDFDREQLMEAFPGARTFPQIRVDDENIGGYTDFEKYIELYNTQVL
jgi:glutaredoxin